MGRPDAKDSLCLPARDAQRYHHLGHMRLMFVQSERRMENDLGQARARAPSRFAAASARGARGSAGSRGSGMTRGAGLRGAGAVAGAVSCVAMVFVLDMVVTDGVQGIEIWL